MIKGVPGKGDSINGKLDNDLKERDKTVQHIGLSSDVNVGSVR